MLGRRVRPRQSSWWAGDSPGAGGYSQWPLPRLIAGPSDGSPFEQCSCSVRLSPSHRSPCKGASSPCQVHVPTQPLSPPSLPAHFSLPLPSSLHFHFPSSLALPFSPTLVCMGLVQCGAFGRCVAAPVRGLPERRHYCRLTMKGGRCGNPLPAILHRTSQCRRSWDRGGGFVGLWLGLGAGASHMGHGSTAGCGRMPPMWCGMERSPAAPLCPCEHALG